MRDYNTGAWIGGDATCRHSPSDTPGKRGLASSTIGGGQRTNGHQHEGYRSECPRCGAMRIDKQIGLESSIQDYIAELLTVFSEVWRILRPEGVVFLNLGDSYAGSWGNYHPNSPPGKHGQRLKDTARWNRPAYASQAFLPPTANCSSSGLKPKDLCLVPERVVLTLQDAGWWVRSRIPWLKRNPMPESTKSRPTTAVEYLFMLAKSERYYWDADAIRIPYAYPDGPNSPQSIASPYGQGFTRRAASHKGSTFHKGKTGINGQGRVSTAERTDTPAGRNRRNADWFFESWQGLMLNEDDLPLALVVNPLGFPGAHFATFPPKLVEPLIKAGSRNGDIVFDPFGGSGTTALVADRLGRHGIGLDLSADYCRLATDRIRTETPLFGAPPSTDDPQGRLL